MQREQLDILIKPNLRLLVYPHSKDAKCFEEKDAADYGESRWQLQEGREYEYEFIDANSDPVKAHFEEKPGIVIPRRKTSEGTIKTGINVGTMQLIVIDDSTKREHSIQIEIQSIKADYRNDYRKMLTDITEYYTDLVMQQGSPVTQKFEVDNDTDPQTLYQKFAFVKSIVDSDTFDESIHKIIQNPVRTWTNTTVTRHIENVKRLNRNTLRQIVSRRDRIKCGAVDGLHSLPRTIEVPHKRDTTNTTENQFVKYVLTQFYSFCTEISGKQKANDQLKSEARIVCNTLLRYIGTTFFKDISMPQHLNLNSPVLQRKEGYREVLQGWLIFDLAAKLSWSGGDNVYDAGKKNVAALYEYWLFFKLLEVISSVFHILPEDKENLVDKDGDNLNLVIKQGRQTMISGIDESSNRKLNVRFYYNRTFGHREDMHKAGSWTMPMRPDYTLSLWPGDIKEEEAENEELIVHIHFDAKYRLNKILIENEDSNLENIDSEDDPLNKELTLEKELEESGEYELGMYKRSDLLKMHAYKDAIRRTSGAYILYPGTERSKKEGFHEIIPGLGAFCICPGKETDQIAALKRFLIEVKKHMLNRVSQREQMAYQSYSIYKEEPLPSDKVCELLPESLGKNRDFRPENTYVLIGYCAPCNQEFVLNKNMYNTRTGHRKGAIGLHELMKANYILLWNESGWQSFQKVKRNSFKVLSDKKYVGMGYTTSEMQKLIEKGFTREQAIDNLPLDDFYTITEFDRRGVEKEFKNMEWYTAGMTKAPKCVKLNKLMELLMK